MITSIYTETEKIPNESQQNVTGTNVDTDKRALDTFTRGSISHIIELAELLIKGTLPEVNWDRIYQTTVSATALTLTFSYQGSIQFYIDATNVFSDFNIVLTETSYITLESGIDRLLLESGDLLLQE